MELCFRAEVDSRRIASLSVIAKTAKLVAASFMKSLVLADMCSCLLIDEAGQKPCSV